MFSDSAPRPKLQEAGWDCWIRVSPPGYSDRLAGSLFVSCFGWRLNWAIAIGQVLAPVLASNRQALALVAVWAGAVASERHSSLPGAVGTRGRAGGAQPFFRRQSTALAVL